MQELKEKLSFMTVEKEEAKTELTKAWKDMLVQAADKVVPGSAKEAYDNIPDFVTKLTTKAREGYVSEKESKARISKALKDFKAYYDSKGITPGSKEVPGGSGGGKGRSGRSADDVLNDPTSTHEERDKAFQEKWGV